MSMTATPLNILAIAPLPFYRDGVKTFLFGGSIFYAELLPSLARRGHAIQIIAETPPFNDGETRIGLDWGLPHLEVEWFALEYRSVPRLRRLRTRRPCEDKLPLSSSVSCGSSDLTLFLLDVKLLPVRS